MQKIKRLGKSFAYYFNDYMQIYECFKGPLLDRQICENIPSYRVQ